MKKGRFWGGMIEFKKKTWYNNKKFQRYSNKTEAYSV